jgi:hypothetical protein
VYVRVPKTGSTSFESQLIEDVDSTDDIRHSAIPFCRIQAKNHVGPAHMNKAHITPDEIYQFLNIDITGYDIYAVLRHPVDKFLSRVCHLEYFTPEDNKDTTKPGPILDKNAVVEKYLNTFNEHTFNSPDTLHWWPQSRWLEFQSRPISNIFLYENISDMMKKLTGNATLRYNHRSLARVDKTYEDLDASLQDHIIKLYQSDYDLYNSLKNKS